MRSCTQLLQDLKSGACDAALAALYAPNGAPGLDQARQRAVRVTKTQQKGIAPADGAPPALVSGPGRTERTGKHTDHQHESGRATSRERE